MLTFISQLDAFSQGIISGLVANGISSFIGYIGGQGMASVRKELATPDETDNANASMAEGLRRALGDLAQVLQGVGREDQRKLQEFFSSPELEAITRQLFATLMPDSTRVGNIELLQEEFAACLALYLERPAAELSMCEGLFESVVACCHHTLQLYIRRGLLSAHEAMSAYRQRIVADELASIKKTLHLLTTVDRPQVADYAAYEVKFRSQVMGRHALITPPFFDSARRVPIDELYVAPKFVPVPVKGETVQPQSIEAFLSASFRAVVLGNPGGGKSTLAQKVTYTLARDSDKRLYGGRQLAPVMVILKDYGVAKRDHGIGILEFIEQMAKSKYQLRPKPGTFDYLLSTGRLLVVFDGLDELLDTTYRQEVSGDIESFCDAYPTVPVLVTSREVGYEQAPLDEAKFKLFRLSEFDRDQVTDYASKWFALDKDLDSERQTSNVEAFMRESEIVPDLRCNPLMLALMCNLYKGEGYIPRNRPDLYEKCAVMLFEQWDKNRGIKHPLPFHESHIAPAMMYLAHWIYSDDILKGGVTEGALVSKASEYLLRRPFEDIDEATASAAEFIRFCRGRAWVFTDTGTTKGGERLYQFTHTTFLEFFTASHLVRLHRTPDILVGALLPKIARQEWDVVAQLAYQLQNKRFEGAGDELLSCSLELSLTLTESHRANVLSFLARCLEFIIPNPQVVRRITRATVDTSMLWALNRIQPGQTDQDDSHIQVPSDTVGNLLYAVPDNQKTIANTLEEILVTRITNGADEHAGLAAELGLHLSLCGWQGPTRYPDLDSDAYWKRVSDAIWSSCADRIRALSRQSVGLAIDRYWRGDLSASDLIRYHGIQTVLEGRAYTMLPSTTGTSVIEGTLIALVRPSSSHLLSSSIESMKKLGLAMAGHPMPWWTRRRPPHVALSFILQLSQEAHGDYSEAFSPDGLFSLFVLFAIAAESSQDRGGIANELKRCIHPLVVKIAPLLLPRFEQVSAPAFQARLTDYEFTSAQCDFVGRWARRKLSFIDYQMRPKGEARG